MIAEVYKNLIRHTYSIRNKDTGRVSFYSKYVMLDDCTFVVREGGRQRVLSTGQKNVHAFVRGRLVARGEAAKVAAFNAHRFYEVKYNPLRFDSFVKCTGMSHIPVTQAKRVILTPFKVFALDPT